jgi:hypothetical protein
MPAPRQPDRLRPLTAAKIDDPNGPWSQLGGQLARHEFLAHHVPQLPQPGLPALLVTGERGTH